ncbi:hypothetical protein ACJIZ3_009688 [Penstemon smallii]|uniref:RNase H type-1 domain-containing protein n=1 Tax=Penstemon smallii TaxID=265156 RepID=A0ABD3TF49_9LAMI
MAQNQLSWKRGKGNKVMKLGQATITKAKLMAVREGLKMAWNMLVEKLAAQCDSKVVVHMINEADTNTHHMIHREGNT